jgi:hypothetical protein
VDIHEPRTAAVVIEWWIAALLGALGGLVADGSRLAGTMLTSKSLPWKGKQQRRAVIFALITRGGCAAAVPSVVALQQVPIDVLKIDKPSPTPLPPPPTV